MIDYSFKQVKVEKAARPSRRRTPSEKWGASHFVLLLLTLAGLAMIARAQVSVILFADVPFRFTVQNTTLPAGTYEFRQAADDPWTWEVIDPKGQIIVTFLTETAEKTIPPTQNELIFNVYGDRHFLSKIWLGTDRDGFYIAKTGAEHAMMKKGTPGLKHVPLSTKKK